MELFKLLHLVKLPLPEQFSGNIDLYISNCKSTINKFFLRTYYKKVKKLMYMLKGNDLFNTKLQDLCRLIDF